MDGTWLPAYETQTVKTAYDEQGQVTKEYTPRGTGENAATSYEYDILFNRKFSLLITLYPHNFRQFFQIHIKGLQ